MAYKLSAAGMELRTPTHGAMKNKEDTTMKKFMTDIKTLAALLMAGAAFTACSSDDNIIEQPQNPTEPQVYTMVIKASKGGDATTRALKPGTDSETGKNTVDAYWSGDETIEVYQSGVKIGEATAAPSANGNTTVTATLTSAPDPSSDLDFYLGGKTPDYTGQVGLLTGTNSISENYDYATDLVYSGAYTVDEINKKITPNEGSLPLTFGAAQQAIIKFTLKDKANDAAISPSALTVTDGTSTVSLTSIPAATYTANGAGVLYVAFPAAGSAKTVTLTATAGGKTYSYEKTGVSFTNGQYYEIGVKMSPIISLSGRTYLDDELVIADGYIVTGSATNFSCKVAVADGATVTLRDVKNDNWSLDPSSACPGIRCIGDATIILEGNNTVKGSDSYAGIYVPEGKTLTIRGTGSLTVTGGSGGAGIGGNNSDANCGSIVISGGTITATGGSHGAGIGLGYSPGYVFGDITISGGTVTATGCDEAPGIGGPNAYFQNITITNDVTKVTVNKGSGSTYSIGTSKSDDMEYCGAITIGSTVYLNEGYFENDGDSYLQTSPLVYQP